MVFGVHNLLEQASRTDSVKRAVITSSCAAICGDDADLRRAPEGVFAEACWNTTSTADHQAYAYVKTLAEREAWALYAQQHQWDPISIKPSLVLGPVVGEPTQSPSFAFMRRFGDGTLKCGVPHWGLGVVDIRDVVEYVARSRTVLTPLGPKSCIVERRW